MDRPGQNFKGGATGDANDHDEFETGSGVLDIVSSAGRPDKRSKT